MKNVITLFSVGFMSVFSTHAETVDKSPEELVHMYYAHGSMFNYEVLVEYVHPYTLGKFRELTDRMIESLIETESEALIFSAFEGVSSQADLAQLSDEDYWVYVMGTIYSYAEQQEWGQGIKYLSSVEDGDYLYAFHRIKNDLVSTPEVERLESPRTITLKKDGKQWKYYSFQIQRVERYLDWHLRNQKYANEQMIQP